MTIYHGTNITIGHCPLSPSSGQILIVQAGGAFTWEELSLAAPVFLAIMTWVGSREGHIQRQSSKPAPSDGMLVNDCYAQ